MSKNLDETVCLQSEIRREVRGERLKGIAEGASSAPRLDSSSAASFLGRNECPGTHCSLIEQEEREDRSATEFEIRGQNKSQIIGEEKRNGRLVGAAETSKEREQNGAGFSGKTGTYWACRKERLASVPQREPLASTPEPPLPKEKGTKPSVQSTRS